MARVLSVIRRKLKLVDLTLRSRAGVKEYQFFALSNFDGSATQFETVPADGKRSKTAPEPATASGFRGLTRFLFNPDDYTASVAAVDDTKPFFIQIKQVGHDGVVGSAEAMHMILPPSSSVHTPFFLAGTVPQGAAIANLLEIQLPFSSKSFTVTNAEAGGGHNLNLAMDPSGPETVLAPQGSYVSTFGLVSAVFVRGIGGTAAVQMSGFYPGSLG